MIQCDEEVPVAVFQGVADDIPENAAHRGGVQQHQVGPPALQRQHRLRPGVGPQDGAALPLVFRYLRPDITGNQEMYQSNITPTATEKDAVNIATHIRAIQSFTA